MIVVAIIAILASIALPMYGNYVIRGRIPDATSNLSALAVRMEQSFQDNRTYRNSAGNGCAFVVSTAAKSNYFDFDCTSDSASKYTLTASGKNSMQEFGYSLTESGVKSTTRVKPGWYKSDTCWTTSKGGC